MKTINTFIILTSILLLTGSTFKGPRVTVLQSGVGIMPDSFGVNTLAVADNNPVKDQHENDIIHLSAIPLQPVAARIIPLTDYLRFDVNQFVADDASEISELPEQENFEYLKFDVNEFEEMNPVDIKEMPVSEFDYLRFDVHKFIAADNNSDTFEMPLAD